MKKSAIRLILFIFKYMLLGLFACLFALFATSSLPVWLSPWWILATYIIYSADCIYLTLSDK